MKKDLDEKLYNNYLNGNKQAFEFLYNKYKNKLQYFIYNIVKDYQKSEDLTQETFIYVMQNPMQDNYSFKYYIYLVAKSRAFNYVSVAKRRNEIDEKYVFNQNTENDVAEIIEKEETKQEMLEAINELEEKYRNAVYLVCIEELTYEETSKILGQTLSNTKSLVHRGKKQLRKILLKKGFNEMNKVLKVFLILLLTTITLTGITYASSIIIKNVQNKLKSYEIEEVKVDEPVSNSEAIAGEIVFKSFYITNDEDKIELDNWQSDDNGLYYKKVSNYMEYKELMDSYSNLRPLVESDFENYFAVIIVSDDTTKTLQYKYITYDNDGENEIMQINISYEENENQDDLQYSGLVVIMTNRHLDYIFSSKIIE